MHVILLVADVLWHAIKAAIDRKLTEANDPGLPNTDEARKRARMRTLLPICRNILFVVVISIAVLMALSAMDVQIAPLIAGAGIVIGALGTVAQGLDAGFDLGCKLHWHWWSCPPRAEGEASAMSPQSTPPVTSPLVPGTRFQQQR